MSILQALAAQIARRPRSAAALAASGLLASGVRAGQEDDESYIDAAARMGRSALSGSQQGLLSGYADEIFGERSRHGEYREAAPVSFAGGEAAGAIVPGLLGAGLVSAIMRERGSIPARIAAASLAGALHGGVMGSGAGEKDDVSTYERLKGALGGAAIGGAVGGLAVPAARAVGDFADNLPALLGRRRLAEGGVEQVALGRGTRSSAPLMVHLRGAGGANDRALSAVQAALARDEFAASQGRGGIELGRFADEIGGQVVTPYSGPRVGPALRSLVDAAARSPAGSASLRTEANILMRRSVARQLREARVRAARGRSGLSGPDRDDLTEAAFMPQAHAGFMTAISRLTAAQRSRVAARVLQRIRAEAKATGLDEVDAVVARLRDPNFAARMEALGVRFPRPRGRGNASALDEAQQEAMAMRARAANTSPIEGLSPEDVALLREGTLQEADALALLRASHRPHRAYFVRPDREARALEGAYEQGVRLRPSDWANVSADDLEQAVVAAQPVAAFAHGVPYFAGPRQD